MTTYFDSTAESVDLLLLPESMRKTQEIANIAAVAERDVIRHYTRRASQYSVLGFPVLAEVINTDLSIVVFLLGYKEDADDADTDADLKQALKDTIADVITWRIRRRLKDPVIATESTDVGKSVTYNALAQAAMPPDFGWRLAPFDLRETLWSL